MPPEAALPPSEPIRQPDLASLLFRHFQQTGRVKKVAGRVVIYIVCWGMYGLHSTMTQPTAVFA
jgi:hypothetical protein